MNEIKFENETRDIYLQTAIVSFEVSFIVKVQA